MFRQAPVKCVMAHLFARKALLVNLYVSYWPLISALGLTQFSSTSCLIPSSSRQSSSFSCPRPPCQPPNSRPPITAAASCFASCSSSSAEFQPPPPSQSRQKRTEAGH